MGELDEPRYALYDWAIGSFVKDDDGFLFTTPDEAEALQERERGDHFQVVEIDPEV